MFEAVVQVPQKVVNYYYIQLWSSASAAHCSGYGDMPTIVGRVICRNRHDFQSRNGQKTQMTHPGVQGVDVVLREIQDPPADC